MMDPTFASDPEFAVLLAIGGSILLLGCSILIRAFVPDEDGTRERAVVAIVAPFGLAFIGAGAWALYALLKAERVATEVGAPQWSGGAFGGWGLAGGIAVLLAAGFAVIVAGSWAEEGGWQRLWAIPATIIAVIGLVMCPAMIASEFRVAEVTATVVDWGETAEGSPYYVASDGRIFKVGHGTYLDTPAEPFGLRCRVHVIPVVEQPVGLLGAGCNPYDG